MSKELNSIILANLESSFTIFNGLDNALYDLLENFSKELEIEFKEIGLSFGSYINFETKYNGINIYRDDWKFVNIGFQFQSYDKDMVYGFCAKKNPVEHPLPTGFFDKLNSLSNSSLKRNGWWPIREKMEAPFDNWEKYEAWKAIVDGTMKSNIIEKVNYLLKLTDGIDL